MGYCQGSAFIVGLLLMQVMQLHTLTYILYCRHTLTYILSCRHTLTYILSCRHTLTYILYCRHTKTRPIHQGGIPESRFNKL